MLTSNQELINRFFACYSKRDFDGLQHVLHPQITWTFNGHHPFAGVKKGIDEVVSFFDAMSSIMSTSKPSVEKLLVAEKENYVIECQHLKTDREDQHNIDHHICVLWTFENGKINSGMHFFADPQAADTFFTYVASIHT